MRLATFNIHHGAPAGARKVDLDAMARVCVDLAADVLALQEVDSGVPRSGGADLAGVVAEATGMAVVFGPTLTRDGGLYGNALLVRGELADVEHVRLPSDWRFWVRREPRAAIVATAVVDGARLSVAGTHLSTRRSESGKQLAAVLEHLGRRSKPRALIGDLNRRPPEVAERLARAGFVPAGGAPTFSARRPLIRIDHVAVNGLRIIDVEVAATQVSDHRPLVVTVEPT
ncbi:hypothetical protein BH18ACT4_BH18ACT4_13800 [soil metagenome]